MRTIEQVIRSKNWLKIFKQISEHVRGKKDYNYVEKIGFTYSYKPDDAVISSDHLVLSAKKLAKMRKWYLSGDRTDKSIYNYFDEYKHCIDENHTEFNSNYGYYAYTLGGLRLCIDRLAKDRGTRQACFCINNNEAMSDNSIDKLCTNAIMFFITEDFTLQMIVQMRSSNFFSLLPYDAIMFASFYHDVFKSLEKKYFNLKKGKITVNAGSIHYYKHQLDKILGL